MLLAQEAVRALAAQGILASCAKTPGPRLMLDAAALSLGVGITAGQTLCLRVYPYNTSAATGKSIMVTNVIVSGVTG